MMIEEIQVVYANKEKVISVQKELEEIMEQSLKVNFLISDARKSSESRFNTLSSYLEEGSAQVYLALYQEKIVGYLWFFEKDANRIHVNEIAVHEEFKAQGIGNKMLDEVIANAKDTEHKQIELFCMENNFFARKFYDKNGFMTEKRLLVKDI